MLYRHFALSLGIAGFVLAADRALPAPTGNSCADRATVIAYLDAQQGSSRRTLALASRRLAVEVYAAHNSLKWSVIVSADDGTTCLISSPRITLPELRVNLSGHPRST